MKKIFTHPGELIAFYMKVSTVVVFALLTSTGLLMANTLDAQKLENVKIDVDFKKITLDEALQRVMNLSGFDLVYTTGLAVEKEVSLTASGIRVSEVLVRLLAGTGFTFRQQQNNVLLLKAPQEKRTPKPGIVSGRITDALSGEPLIGSTVIVKGTSIGVTTDVEGSYKIPLEPGIYAIEFRFVGYKGKIVENVEVKESQITKLDVILEQDATSLGEVVITETYDKASAEGLYARQKNNSAITDGIASDLIRRTPDRNAGEALKRVTGISIQEGKFVVVRGLADRYNYTMLNGGMLPSTEPDRRAFSLDLIPSQVIESVVVTKTATADLPGEFAGGIVQVTTRDFPEQDFLSVTVGSGIYSGVTGKPFLKDYNGTRDRLGYDDGGRSIPKEINLTAGQLKLYNPEEVFRISNSMAKGWEPVKAGKAQPISQFQVNYGKVFNFENNHKLGILALGSYRRDQVIYQGQRYDIARYRKYDGVGGPGDTLRFMRTYDYERMYRYQVNAGGLLNIAYQFGQSKVSIKNIFNRDFETVTTEKIGEKVIGDDFEMALNRTIDMHPVQKTLMGTQVQGDHKLGDTALPVTLLWNVSYNRVSKYEPNQTRISYINPYQIDSVRFEGKNYYVPEFSTVSGASRLYTDLKEDVYNVNFSVSAPFKIADQPQIFKGGAYTQFRKRDYFTRNLGYADSERFLNTWMDNGMPTPFPINFNVPIDDLLSPGNFRPGGIVLTNYELPANEYIGAANLASAFVNMENTFFTKLRVVYGARVEFNTMSLSTSKKLARRLPGDNGVGEQSPIDYTRYNTDLLPSASVTYSPFENFKVRGAYSKSLTRPEFREISPYEYFDFVSGYTTIGNPELNRGTIQNLDFRVEWYPSAGEIISAGVFYKKLKDPVEFITRATTSTTGFVRSYANIPGAENSGIEFEFRKSLFVNGGPEWLRNITLFGNYARIFSKITGTLQGYQSADVNSRYRERPLMGQSPYLVNAGVLVNAFDNKLSFSASFNRIGRRITVVGTTAEDRAPIGAYPDVYENPRNQLDLQLGVRVLKQRAEIRFNAVNLINDPYVQYQDFDLNGKYSGKIFDGTVYARESFRQYTFSFTYNFGKIN